MLWSKGLLIGEAPGCLWAKARRFGLTYDE